MFKKYLLSVSDMAFLNGFIIILFPCVILGVVVTVAGLPPEVFTTLLLVGFGGGIVLGAIQSYFRHTRISHVDDFRDRGLSSPRLVKADGRGRVVDFHDSRLWGRDGVHHIQLPFAWRGEFTTSTRIRHKVDGVDVSAKITLTAYVPKEDEDLIEGVFKHGFIPQELFDVVIQEGYISVESWLAAAFKEAAEDTPAIQEAFETHGRPKDPFALTKALTEALETVPFSPRLSNISSVDASVVVDSSSFTTKVTYH